MLEGTQTVCVLVGPEPMARSSAGLTLQLGARDSRLGARFSARLFNGLDTGARVVRARARGVDDVRVCLSTAAC
jgi:hypothetical protein